MWQIKRSWGQFYDDYLKTTFRVLIAVIRSQLMDNSNKKGTTQLLSVKKKKVLLAALKLLRSKPLNEPKSFSSMFPQGAAKAPILTPQSSMGRLTGAGRHSSDPASTADCSSRNSSKKKKKDSNISVVTIQCDIRKKTWDHIFVDFRLNHVYGEDGRSSI